MYMRAFAALHFVRCWRASGLCHCLSSPFATLLWIWEFWNLCRWQHGHMLLPAIVLWQYFDDVNYTAGLVACEEQTSYRKSWLLRTRVSKTINIVWKNFLIYSIMRSLKSISFFFFKLSHNRKNSSFLINFLFNRSQHGLSGENG